MDNLIEFIIKDVRELGVIGTDHRVGKLIIRLFKDIENLGYELEKETKQHIQGMQYEIDTIETKKQYLLRFFNGLTKKDMQKLVDQLSLEIEKSTAEYATVDCSKYINDLLKLY